MLTVLIISIIISVMIFILGLVVLKSNSKNIVNQLFLFLTLFVALWTIFYALSNFGFNPLISIKLTDIFGIWGAILLFCFVLVYPENNFPNFNRIIKSISILLAVFLTPIIIFTTLVVSGVEFSGNIAIPKFGLIAWPFFVLTYFYLICSAILLVYKYFKEYKNNLKQKRKLRFVIFGAGITAILIAIMSFYGLLLDKDTSWIIDVLTPFSSIAFIALTSYGILKGGLFDVRTAIVRSATYSLVLATMAGIYVVTTSILSAVLGFGQSSWAELFGDIAISLVLVFIFQPLRKFFDRVTNKIFYKDNYNSDEFFARLNKTLALTTDLRGLLERTASEIGKTLKSSQAFFFINTDNGHFVTAGTKGHTQLSRVDACIFISAPKNKSGLIVSSMDEDDAIKQRLSEHKIEIILPLIQDGDVVGLLCLGENLSSNYTNRDIQVLDTISNGLIIAIQNALSVQQIRDFNVTLRQKINEATQELRVKNAMLKKLDKAKDEFVSMASHQLRTPLTSVKGYLSMVVDGDAGKITAQQKSLLGEAYSSSERMVNLVNDFLNVSRIQTGKFMLEKIPVDLAKLVNEEVNGLVQNAAKRQIKLAYDAPNGVPKLNVDEGKIRQVVMNYIDNAIYYSNMDSTIKIGLSVDNDDVVFTVKDTGIGVPVSEQAGLFTKFYRASNAKKQRPDGTGVGLYLAKKIITAHDGKIVFSTIEGKGSTFGFRLPIKELELSADKEIENLKD